MQLRKLALLWCQKPRDEPRRIAEKPKSSWRRPLWSRGLTDVALKLFTLDAYMLFALSKRVTWMTRRKNKKRCHLRGNKQAQDLKSYEQESD